MTPIHDKSDRQLLNDINIRTARIESALFGATDGDVGFVQLTRDKVRAQDKRLIRVERISYVISGAILILAWLIEHQETISHLLGK